MHRTRWLLACALLITTPAARLDAEQPRNHALLIGCTDYENLDTQFQLKGGGNDVQLFARLLVDRFDFDPKVDDIVTLAAGRAARYEPTRANIQREFRRLGNSVGAGETVVILMAGHGSQQPDDDPENPLDVETDGLDEIFLPSDVEGFDGKTGRVTGAIVDDEFRQWLSKIVARKAFVWLIMDTCHSGSGVRGSDAEIKRHVPPSTLIPQDALASAQSNAFNRNPRSAATNPIFDGPGGVVAIYAAQSNEQTPEKKLPVGASPEARKYHGLLTYTISEILIGTRRGLTYNELVQAIQTRYIMMGRRAPTPLVEGTHRDHLVLGRESFPGRSRILLRRSKVASAGMTINAGAIHSLTAGSILAVHPPPGSNADPRLVLGHVRVRRVDVTEASVEPCRYASVARPRIDELPNRARCEVVFHHAGIERLRVAIDREKEAENEHSDSIDEMDAKLRSHHSSRIMFVDSPGEADLLVRYGVDTIQIIPAEGVSQGELSGQRLATEPLPGNVGSTERVIQSLEKIARARALLKLAAVATKTSPQRDLGFSLKVTDDQRQPLRWQTSGYTVRDGERVFVEMENSAMHSVDVSLLYVDSGFGITCLYPAIGEINRIAANEKQVIELKITATTTGIENLVAIAVKADRQPVDFRILEQSTLSQTRGSANASLDSPLGLLFRSAMYGQGTARGLERAPNQNYDIQLITWSVNP